MATDKPTLFEQVEAKSSEKHKIGISLVDYERVKVDENDKPTNLREVIKDEDIIYFEINPVTPDVDEAADKITSQVQPKPLMEDRTDEQMGLIKVQNGYDYNEPEYLSKMAVLERKREIFICLACCEELMKSAPGKEIDEKIAAVKKKIARPIINSLFNCIINLGAYHNDADSFFGEGLNDSPS